jgi:pimeloyl-ACP methyl ester carboxylesterase
MSAIAGHDTRSRLSELAGLPTLVIHGTEDRIVPVQQGRDLAASIPGARLIEIAGAGHLLVTDAEAEVSGAVLDHLRRLAPLESAR